MAANSSEAPTASVRAERLLARFENEYPEARGYQVTVEISEGRRHRLLILPASGRPRGAVRLLFCPANGVRLVAVPAGLGREAARAVRHLAEALSATLLREPWDTNPFTS